MRRVREKVRKREVKRHTWEENSLSERERRKERERERRKVIFMAHESVGHQRFISG